MLDITIKNYGRYRSENYGAHTKLVIVGNKSLWFSYDTLVAFSAGGEFHIIKNYWGNTTGKHLNWINPDKSIREDEKTFHYNAERLVM